VAVGDFDTRDASGAAALFFFPGSGLVVVGDFDIRDACGAAAYFLFFILFLFFRQWTGGLWGF
jgi:hypothetical protein